MLLKKATTPLNSTTVRAPRRFGELYREHLLLKDGTRIVLRTVLPEDKEVLRVGFQRMSAESRFKRFLSYKMSLTERELRYFTDIDGETHFALAAGQPLVGGGVEGIGTARFVCLKEDPGAAEAAVTILDDWQGRGVGRILFEHLMAAARERHVERLNCTVLASNKAMLGLLSSYPESERRWQGDSIQITLDLGAPEPTSPK